MSFLTLYQAPNAQNIGALENRLNAGASTTSPQTTAYIWDGSTPLPSGVALKVTTRTNETHRLTAELTEQVLEDGSVVSEHIILRPRALSVEYEQPNSFDGTTLAWQAWTAAKAMWRNRKVLRVMTAHELYNNMVIEQVSAIHEAPHLGRLTFSIHLKQVYFASINAVVLPGFLAGPVQATASSPVNAGIQKGVSTDEATTPNASAAFNAFNQVFPQNYDLAPGSYQVPGQ
jgi:hypothetical protein